MFKRLDLLLTFIHRDAFIHPFLAAARVARYQFWFVLGALGSRWHARVCDVSVVTLY